MLEIICDAVRDDQSVAEIRSPFSFLSFVFSFFLNPFADQNRSQELKDAVWDAYQISSYWSRVLEDAYLSY